jgi:CGNR zinc finger
MPRSSSGCGCRRRRRRKRPPSSAATATAASGTGCGGERGRSAEQQLAPADAVAEHAGADQRAAEHEDVAVHDPEQLDVAGSGTRPRSLDGRGDDPADPELTTLADELHPIFAATEDGDRAARINALLERTGVRPILAGDRLAQTWLVEDPSEARRASAALALREQLAEHPGRIGVCADRRCADVYVNQSPAGRRRFCCLTCQNRARAEAFRKRRTSG